MTKSTQNQRGASVDVGVAIDVDAGADPGVAIDADPGLPIDVVVVGGGIAGLAAADHLVAAGRSVVVFEAGDRVGGRLLSVPAVGGAALDLGATWYWPGEHRVVTLVDRLGVQTFPQHLAGAAMYHEPAGSQRLDGNPLDVPSGRFVAGAQQLATALAESLPPSVVRLNSPVATISAADSGMAVQQTGLPPVACGHVIIAVPPALAVSAITFDPPLPDRLAGLAAATPVWMGAVTKVVVQFDKPFWRNLGLAGSAISHHGPMREMHDMSGQNGQPAALFGFVPGTPAEAPTVTEAQIVGQLVEIFGSPAADPQQVLIHDWRDEPLTSPPGVERLTAYQTFGHDLYQQPAADGRLHFCSTETSVENPGHIEGSLAAAERAVNLVLERYTTS